MAIFIFNTRTKKYSINLREIQGCSQTPSAWRPVSLDHNEQHTTLMQSISVFTANILFILILFCTGQELMAQPKIDTAAVIRQLETIRERDQKTRTSGDSLEFATFIDSCNLAQVEALVAKYGWLKRSFVGARGNFTAFLIIQHADLKTQEKYFPLIKQSVEIGESRPADLAVLQDRILMRQGKKQIYGSQIVFDKAGNQVLYPIEDERNVNKRRAKAGLEPMEEYARHFGINYVLPK